jgi:hypothetical protein
MSSDPMLASVARLFVPKTLRVDRQTGTLSWSPPRFSSQIVLAILAAFFVLVGAIDLDLGASEGRLGLAAGERPGPLGQVVGYWAPDLWPAEVLPSYLLAQLEPGGRPSSAAVRWPASGPDFWRLLVRKFRIDRPLRRRWPGPDRRARHPGRARAIALGQRSLDGGPLGFTCVSFGRPATSLHHRPGDRCHRPNDGAPLARPGDSATGGCRPLVALDQRSHFLGSLRHGAGAAIHTKTRVAAGAWCSGFGSAI